MFLNEIIYFLARIDQQAEIYHSSLSKQDITNETKTTQKKTTQKNKYILNLVFSRKSISIEIKIRG